MGLGSIGHAGLPPFVLFHFAKSRSAAPTTTGARARLIGILAGEPPVVRRGVAQEALTRAQRLPDDAQLAAPVSGSVDIRIDAHALVAALVQDADGLEECARGGIVRLHMKKCDAS